MDKRPPTGNKDVFGNLEDAAVSGVSNAARVAVEE